MKSFWGLSGLLKWRNILELQWGMCFCLPFAKLCPFRKVMDLLMDVVGNITGGRSEDEKPDNDFFDGNEEEEELLDD